VTSWLEAQGVKFSPGDKVLVNDSGDLVVLAAQKETLDRVDQGLPIVGAVEQKDPDLLIEIDLVEIPAAKAPALGGEIPVNVLSKAASRSWHFLNIMEITAVSGQRVTAVTRGLAETKVSTVAPGQPSPPDDTGPLPPGVLGASAVVETALDDQRKNIQLNLTYHYRGAGKRVWDTASALSLVVADGLPTVAQLETAPEDGARGKSPKVRALIVAVYVLHPHKTAAHGEQPPPSSAAPAVPAH
jgi:hypothetical protein